MRPLNDPQDCRDYAKLSRRVTEALTKLSSAMSERARLENAIEKSDSTVVSARDALQIAEGNLIRWQKGEDYNTITQSTPAVRSLADEEEDDEEED